MGLDTHQSATERNRTAKKYNRPKPATHQSATERDRPKPVHKSTQGVHSETGQIRAHGTRNALLVRWYRLKADDAPRAILAGAWACNSRTVPVGVTAKAAYSKWQEVAEKWQGIGVEKWPEG